MRYKAIVADDNVGHRLDAIVIGPKMNEEDMFGFLWCLLNSTPDLNYAASIKLMHEIERKLGDKKLNEYWQIFISG